MPSVIAHLLVASWVALRNPVNTLPVIQLFYLSTVFTCFATLYYGWKYAYQASTTATESKKRALVNLHKARMGLLYITSISGAGAVRLTVWVQWIFGKFFRYV